MTRHTSLIPCQYTVAGLHAVIPEFITYFNAVYGQVGVSYQQRVVHHFHTIHHMYRCFMNYILTLILTRTFTGMYGCVVCCSRVLKIRFALRK